MKEAPATILKYLNSCLFVEYFTGEKIHMPRTGYQPIIYHHERVIPNSWSKTFFFNLTQKELLQGSKLNLHFAEVKNCDLFFHIPLYISYIILEINQCSRFMTNLNSSLFWSQCTC